MYNKYITDEGKEAILKLAFSNDTAATPFVYAALGDENSEGSTGTGDFSEISGSQYQRVATTNEGVTNNAIQVSCIFDENNYNGDSKTVKEIALFDSLDSNATAFAYCAVPPIEKNGNISLKYTFIINIE